MASRFAPVELRVDLSALDARDRKALAYLVRAAQALDGVYLRQVWPGNGALLVRLAADTTPLGRARLHAFLFNKGPWSELDGASSFIDGVGSRPPAGNFYPPDMSKEAIDRWLHLLDEKDRKDASSFYTVIRRAPDGGMRVVPYSVEYQGELARAASLMREAAAVTTSPTLRKYLDTRAAAFLSNDYYESDLAWMNLDGIIEPTIGPYEVYEDRFYNAKAAFEAFLCVRDDAETQKLERLGAELQGLEDTLPEDPSLRHSKVGALSPIRVVDEIFASGDANHGVQTAAFDLPNDERIATEKGTKRVMLKNVQQAKFDKVLVPIARIALAPADRKNVSFDAFFTHILMHELMHGLGPSTIAVAGAKGVKPRSSTVRAELQDLFSAIEEAKADVTGLWALQQLVDAGKLDKSLEKTMYVTFLAETFRSVRFGTGEAHGQGVALQIAWMLSHGAFRVAADGTFSVDAAKARTAVAELAHELLEIEGHGDRAAAQKLLDGGYLLAPEVKRVIEKLKDVPVDVEPRFVTADELVGDSPSTTTAKQGGRR